MARARAVSLTEAPTFLPSLSARHAVCSQWSPATLQAPTPVGRLAAGWQSPGGTNGRGIDERIRTELRTCTPHLVPYECGARGAHPVHGGGRGTRCLRLPAPGGEGRRRGG